MISYIVLSEFLLSNKDKDNIEKLREYFSSSLCANIDINMSDKEILNSDLNISIKTDEEIGVVHYLTLTDKTISLFTCCVLFLLMNSHGPMLKVNCSFMSKMVPIPYKYPEIIKLTSSILNELFDINIKPMRTLDIKAKQEGMSNYIFLPEVLSNNPEMFNWSGFNLDFSQFTFNSGQISRFLRNNPNQLVKELGEDKYTIYNFDIEDNSMCESTENDLKKFKNHLCSIPIYDSTGENVVGDMSSTLLKKHTNTLICNLVYYFNSKYLYNLKEDNFIAEDRITPENFCTEIFLSILLSEIKYSQVSNYYEEQGHKELLFKFKSLAKLGKVKVRFDTLTIKDAFAYEKEIYPVTEGVFFKFTENKQGLELMLKLLSIHDSKAYIEQLQPINMEVPYVWQDCYIKFNRLLNEKEFFKPFSSARTNRIESVTLKKDNSLEIKFLSIPLLKKFINFIYVSD